MISGAPRTIAAAARRLGSSEISQEAGQNEFFVDGHVVLGHGKRQPRVPASGQRLAGKSEDMVVIESFNGGQVVVGEHLPGFGAEVHDAAGDGNAWPVEVAVVADRMTLGHQRSYQSGADESGIA